MWILVWYWLLSCGFYFCGGSVNLAFRRPAIQSSINNGDIYGPERALDNNTLGTFEIAGENKGLGTCCHTVVGEVSPEVYWEVDLGNVSIITRLVIQYRKTHPERLNGYIIEVSDQSLGNGTICYRDTAPGNPPTYVTHDCIVIGRYVRYENNVGYAELCNFEAYGCPVNYHGDNCTLPCPRNCLTPSCNPDNGTCIGRCQPGYKGNQCYEGCDNGTFGSNCVYQCYCRGEPCDTSTGVCSSGCQKGYQGVSCNQTCMSEQFGYDCLTQCHCVGTECDAVNGRCVSDICLPGWTLPSCCQKCQSQTFGHNCTESCGTCRDGVTCDHVTGICDNGCADGWIGLHCNMSCNPGMYGFNCSKECGHCFNTTCTSCNNVDGHCDKCDYGYRGTKCDSKCPMKTYDVDNSQDCSRCFIDNCNVVNRTCLQGCLPGFGNSLCTEHDTSYNSGLVGGILFVCLLQVCELFVLFILYRKGKVVFRFIQKENVYADATKDRPDNNVYSTTNISTRDTHVYSTAANSSTGDNHVYSTMDSSTGDNRQYSTMDSSTGDNSQIDDKFYNL